MNFYRSILRTACIKQGSVCVSQSCDVQAAVSEGSVGAALLNVLQSAQQTGKHAQQAPSRNSAEQQQQQLWQQQWQQQHPVSALQLLQSMGAIHRQLHCFHTAAVCHSPCAQQQLQQSQQQLQQQQQQQEDDVIQQACEAHLQPYQAVAVQAAVTQLAVGKQRMLLRLPPCADINPVITRLVTHFHPTHVVFVLMSSTARVWQLKAALQSVGQNPRVVPLDLIKTQDKVLLVDLEQLQKMPSASIHLMQQQVGQQGIAIYEEGFLNPSSSSSSSSNSDMQQGSLFHGSKRAAAEQLLRQLKFLEPNPGRLLLSISSREWHMMLLKQQPGSSSSSEPQFQAFELTAAEALHAGLIKRAAAVQIPTGVEVPASFAAAAEGNAASQASSSSSSSSSEFSLAISTPERNALVAHAYQTSANNHKAVVCAADELHARQLAVTLNLQGISSLVLHQSQNPEDQAAVLDAFCHGPDKVLVSSLNTDFTAGLSLGCDVKYVFMAAPTLNPRVYAARLAPVLLSYAPFGGSSSSSAEGDQLTVVDFVDRLIGASSSSSNNGGVSSSSNKMNSGLTCSDVLGSLCIITSLPPQLAAISGSSSSSISMADQPAAPAAVLQGTDPELSRRRRRKSSSSSDSDARTAAAAAAASTSSSNSSSSAQPAIRGNLIWTILDNGSWAIPISRGRGVKFTGSKILWLSKIGRGWVPQLEEGLGQLSPLPGTSGKPLKLQRARLLAEAWMTANHPKEAAIRESGLEWRDRPMSDYQTLFCERFKIPYDPSWSRGTASNALDRYVVETMRVPSTERQLFLARHLAPYAPGYLLTPKSTSLSYCQAAEHMLEALLTGNFSKTSAQRSNAATKTSAAASAAAGAGGSGGQSVGDSVGRDDVLPSRTALLRELEMQYDAGLRPRYTWTVINDRDMLLDLMCGSYLWLKRVTSAAAASTTTEAAAAAATTAPEAAAAAAEESSSSDSTAELEMLDGDDTAAVAADSSGDSSSSTADTPAAAAAAGGLDASAPYQLMLELPNGSMHYITGAPAPAAALLKQYAADPTKPSSSSSSSSNAPLDLTTALNRAERIAHSLSTQGLAFLSREAVVRIAGMVGGWKVPSLQSEHSMAMPASARQLELLRAAGLPHSRRYTCLDAHRELVRYNKTHNIPEPLATPSQLARLQELKLPLAPGAAAVLTAAEAKALLFRVQVAEEKRQQQGPIMGRGPQARRRDRP